MADAAAPVYLLQGDDPSLLSEELRRLIVTLVGGDDQALAVEDIGGDDLDVGAVLDACLTPPFFTDRRVIVVRDVGRFGDDAIARLSDYLTQPLETSHLVLVAGGGRTSQKLANAVKKAGAVVSASTPTGRARTAWLAERLRDAPIDLDRAAADLVGEHLGEDLGRLSSLLGALTSAYGDGARLSVDDVAPFLGEAGGVAPWDLTDAIDRGDIPVALDALHRMLAAGGRHPLVVMATLQRHFTSMLKLDGAGVTSEKEAAGVLGLRGSTFPAKKAMSQARRLGWAGISEAVQLLAEADLDLRGARAWPDTLVVDVLVARLCRLSRRPTRRT
jgi:DNA polymerase-3 subunit delta